MLFLTREQHRMSTETHLYVTKVTYRDMMEEGKAC